MFHESFEILSNENSSDPSQSAKRPKTYLVFSAVLLLLFFVYIRNMSTFANHECASKAGRHRLYSNEQRKDRNRQAQAAFRDRRSKHTQDLEAAVIKFQERIKSLEETNSKTAERAQLAEERCTQLDSEVISLQKLLQITLADNQRLQAQAALNSLHNEALPLSPNDSSATSEIVSSPKTSSFLISSLDELPTNMASVGQQSVHPVQLPTHQEQHFDNGLFDTKDINTWLEMNPSITDHYPRRYLFTDHQNEFSLDIL